MWIDHNFFIHSSVHGQLVHFPHLAVVNRASVNTLVQGFVWVSVSGSWYSFKKGLLRTILNLESSGCQFSELPVNCQACVHQGSQCGGSWHGHHSMPQLIAGGSLHRWHPSFFLPCLLILPFFLSLYTPLPPGHKLSRGPLGGSLTQDVPNPVQKRIRSAQGSGSELRTP